MNDLDMQELMKIYEQGYGFYWKGKGQAVKDAENNESEHIDYYDGNLYIEGDNLVALKRLQRDYSGKIKMIYIDPPYNTRKTFVYDDNFKKAKKDSLSDGDRLHSNWLNMMYPRLKVARDLLTDDGVIFISISNEEIANLKKICDEIFGEANYINTINIKTKASSGASGGGEDRKLKKNIEYLLAYSKSSYFNSFNSIYKYTPLNEYISERKKEGKNFAYTSVMVNEGIEKVVTSIKAGNGEEILIKKVENYEIKSINKIAKEENISEYEVYQKYINKIFTLENAQTSIRDRVIEATGKKDEYYNCYYKPVSGKNKGILTKVGFMGTTKRLVSYLSNVVEIDKEKIIKKDKIGTLWEDLSWSSIHLEGEVEYNNGKKPIALIKRLLEMISFKNNDIILDFFSGSSTTIHAMFEYNMKYANDIKCILIQFPESLEKNLETASAKNKKDILKQIDFLENINKPLFITEIGKERIRRAGEKIKADETLPAENREKLDTDFKVITL